MFCGLFVGVFSLVWLCFWGFLGFFGGCVSVLGFGFVCFVLGGLFFGVLFIQPY